VIGGVYLLTTSRRSVGSGPRCGQCQYNLTGAPGNRCPECGSLFIEAGIVMSPATSLRKRRWVGIVLIAAPWIPLMFGLLATTLAVRAQQARMEAVRARDMALQARAAQMQALQAQTQSAAQNPPVTAPASQPTP
jgi:hypothetical protein